MFGVVREFQAPIGVTHAVRGRFGPSSNSLGVVFARKNSLDIYVVRANREVAHLELLQSTPLGANVLSMSVLRRGNGPVDFLVVSFDRLRAAAMAWDHDTRSWRTEQTIDLGSLLGAKLCSPSTIMRSQDPSDFGRPILRGVFGQFGQPLVRTDPAGRCFAVLAKQHSAIYIIPVHADDDLSQPDARVANRNDIFLIDLPTEYEASNIKDFSFLHGSFEPNLLILHESKRTWAGRAATQRNTCGILSISVDLRSKRHSKTWTMDELPYDAERIEPIPESAGSGALVVSTSVLIQVRHGACVAGLSLNCFGDAYAAEMKGRYDTITQSDTLVECDAAHCRFLDFQEHAQDISTGMQCIALLALKGGELYFLNLAAGSRSTLTMKRAGSTVIASEIVPINDRFFVLASRLSDSLLIEYQKVLDEGGENGQVAGSNGNYAAAGNSSVTPKTKGGKRKKRKRTAEEEAEYELFHGTQLPPESSDEESDEDTGTKQAALKLEEKDEGTRGVYDDDDELGWVFNSGPENDATNSKGGDGNWALKVKDTITCFGPGADLAVGASPDDATGMKLDMVIAGGYGKNGCLAVVHQSIRPRSHAEFDVPGCDGIWTLHDPRVAKLERLEREERNAATSLRNAARRARNTKKLAARKIFVEQEIMEIKKKQPKQSMEKKNTPDEKQSNGQGLEAKKEPNSRSATNASLTAGSPLTKMSTAAEGHSDHSPVQAQAEERDGPPQKKTRRNEGNDTEPSEKQQCDQNNVTAIPAEVMSQIEQQAEGNFPLEQEEVLEESVADEGALHAYMLLSRGTATTIMKTGVDLVELVGGEGDFTTNERTIAAGNILGKCAIVQVVPSKVKILMNGKSQCEYKPEGSSSFIKHAQISDPLIMIQRHDGGVEVLKVTGEKFNERQAGKHHGIAMPPQDDIADEYGMSLGMDGEVSATAKSNGIQEHKTASEQNSSQPNEEEGNSIAYKNLSISIDFSTSAHLKDIQTVTAAYLYKGPLAREVAKDGILRAEDYSEDNKEEAAEQDIAPDTLPGSEDGAAAVSSKTENADVTENDAREQTEDDDRMLYGDVAEDEDDLMLYGSGNTNDANPKKAEVPTEHKDTLGNGSASGRESVLPWEANLSHAVEGKRVPSIPAEKGVIAISVERDTLEQEQLLLICEANGTLLILSPALGWKVVLDCAGFFAAPSLVMDAPVSEEDKSHGAVPFASPELCVTSIGLVELSGSALLAGRSTPLLAALPANGVPIIYRAFMKSVSSKPSRSRSRLCLHRILFKDRTAALLAKSVICARQISRPAAKKEKKVPSPLVPFQNIAGRSGMFIGGSCPLFLFAERGYPRIHALSHTNYTAPVVCSEDYYEGQGVVAFTEFHNVKCPRGFVSAGQDGVVRIGSLPPPSVMNYDAPTPMRKIALRCTPHKVAYHSGSATYGVLASMPTLTTREERLARILQSLEKHDKRHYQHTAAQAEAETGDERANRVPPLFEEHHELRIYRPDTWELIKSHKLKKGEVGLAIANMTVDVYRQRMASAGVMIPDSRKSDDGNESAFAASLKMRPKNMLVIGTGYLNGEDASSRGRLLLFEISKQEVYTEAGGMFTAFQLQLIAEKELFSPVTAVASMEGYVIAGVGPQLSVYKLVGDEIIHLSFAFGQLYCTSLASIKQYVVAADMCKSVSFMYFRDRNNSVNFLGKDYENVTSFGTEFLIENENMSIIVSDGNGNLQLMNYAHASVPESRGGKRLLINGGTHFGSRINKFVRVRMPDSRADLQSGRAPNKAGKHALLFTTLDGGVGALVSVTEVQFRKLRALRKQVLEHPGIVRQAGVNPIEQTTFRPESASTVLLDQRLLDSRVVFDVFGTTLVEMSMIARKAETDIVGMAQTFTELDAVLAKF